MAVEALATSLSGVGGAGPIPSAGAQVGVGFPQSSPQSSRIGQDGGRVGAEQAQPIREAGLEARAGRIGGPAENAVRAAPPEVTATPHRGGDSIGSRVLNSVDRLQRGDSSWRAGQTGQAPSANEPTLRVAARAPGPAEAPLRSDAAHGPEIAGHPTTQPGRSANPSFDGMIHQLEQVSGQVIQVSIVSKTTSSFTGSLNKLLSSS